MLGVSVETLRRWETEGRAPDGALGRAASASSRSTRSARLLDERRKASTDRPIVAQSARNRFAGIVTRIEKDRVAAVVEVIAGPHRLVSLMTAEAVDELGLKVGDEAVVRRQGHQRDRRDPVRRRSPEHEVPARRPVGRSCRSSSPPARAARASPSRQRRRSPVGRRRGRHRRRRSAAAA